MNPVLAGILVSHFTRPPNRGFISCNCGSNLDTMATMQPGFLRHIGNTGCFEVSCDRNAHILAGEDH
jgi:hypothetical protein